MRALIARMASEVHRHGAGDGILRLSLERRRDTRPPSAAPRRVPGPVIWIDELKRESETLRMPEHCDWTLTGDADAPTLSSLQDRLDHASHMESISISLLRHGDTLELDARQRTETQWSALYQWERSEWARVGVRLAVALLERARVALDVERLHARMSLGTLVICADCDTEQTQAAAAPLVDLGVDKTLGAHALTVTAHGVCVDGR